MPKKLQYAIIAIMFFFSFQINSQENRRIGIHQEHKNQFGKKVKVLSKFDLTGKDIFPLKKPLVKSLSKIVFGFLPDWEYANGAHTNMQYDLLSHLAVFDFTVSSSGAISNPSAWPWTDVINAAHDAGTKVIMTAVNFNGAEIHNILSNSTIKNKFQTEVKRIISSYNLDGVNVDFETLNKEDEGAKINEFMADLTNYIHTELPGKEVSFDSPAVNWNNDWNLEGLAESVDYLFIMAYDYHGSWSKNTGAVAPLTNPDGGISLTKTLNDDYNIAISKYPEKLILGVPYYGKHWKTSTSFAGSSIVSYDGSTFYRTAVNDAANKGGFIWNDDSQTPFYRWNASGWNQVWQDNEESIAKKYDLALAENLGGIGIWALNYDGNKNELWELINSKFNTALSVNDAFIKENIQIYPNPVHTSFKISNPNFVVLKKVEIYNYYGQKLNAFDNHNNIDMGNLTKGIYIINIVAENGQRGAFKIIKN